MDLKGKVALVTGASRGIGKAIALALAKEGADVVAAARTTDARPVKLPGTVEETARAVQALGRRGLGIQMDVTKDDEVEKGIRKTVETLGRIDILVNNAGISFGGTILEVAIQRWDLVMNVNMRGAYLCSRFALEHMIKQKSGAILNISSGAATSTRPGRLSYGVSKAAMDRFTVGLAAELKEHRIPVNSLEVDLAIASEGFIYVSPGVDFSKWEKTEVGGEASVWVLKQDPEYTGKVVTITELRQKHQVALAR